MLGYVVGMLITPIAGQWAAAVGDGALLSELLFMCEALFSIAFLFGLVRLLLRAVRWLVRASVRPGRSREASP
ncbi:hypothetical protein EDD27_6286 [Nonomuraea polychroma]|uniref:Uncharacterized protein n=2 Tax=Nonomuraea polychroma TaxID=46176 RepID=A0A438MDI5_9ACTN|nr:hypothetical protein EDD27_6286 [Nonomuraea polychroma]